MIAERLANVRQRIAHAAEAAGRDPAEIELVAVSKTHPADAVRACFDAGQRIFGENKAQELADKCDALGRGPIWHFIGHLQRNKVRFVVGRATLIHSIDSVRLADAVSKRAVADSLTVGALVQVNTSAEDSKGGVEPSEALALCEHVQGLEGLQLRGLMTIPAPTEDPDGARPAFARLRELATQGRDRGLPLTELSMGMSHDLEAAIAEGATMVRVGTAIFGPRNG